LLLHLHWLRLLVNGACAEWSIRTEKNKRREVTGAESTGSPAQDLATRHLDLVIAKSAAT
jgi:hypothetical protein